MNGGARTSGDSIREQSGGCLWCESSGAVVSNCVLSGGYAPQFGGGAFRGTLFNCILTTNSAAYGGGAASNTLFNCTLARNTAAYQNLNYGGGVYGCTLSNCLLVGNQTLGGGGFGGGAAFSSLMSCVVSNNSAGGSGGGIYLGVINDSLISSNRASLYGGGAYSNVLNNCVLKNNVASGNGAGAFGSVLVNCTVVSNATPVDRGGGGGVSGGSASNSIIYYNFSGKDPNFPANTPMNYCCTPTIATNGFGNITNEPLFVNVTNDFHLQSNSPCINAGNNSYVTFTNDLDGSPRIAGGTVDIGAYEFQSPASVISYAYLQQYGLPTDGSADYLDSDGDGLNNWQEWIAGLNPTNPASVLKLSAPVPTNNLTGVVVSWQSVSNRTYFLQRSRNLSAHPAFSSIQSNILGQAGTTSYTDVSATNSTQYFYRVGVQ
jgi:hypothetical protein